MPQKVMGGKNHCRTKVRAVSLSKLLYPLQHSIWLILQCISYQCRSSPLRLLLNAKHVREGRSDVKVYFWQGFDTAWVLSSCFHTHWWFVHINSLMETRRRMPDVIPLAHRGSAPSSNTYFNITLGLGSDSARFQWKCGVTINKIPSWLFTPHTE